MRVASQLNSPLCVCSFLSSAAEGISSAGSFSVCTEVLPFDLVSPYFSSRLSMNCLWWRSTSPLSFIIISMPRNVKGVPFVRVCSLSRVQTCPRADRKESLIGPACVCSRKSSTYTTKMPRSCFELSPFSVSLQTWESDEQHWR